jgi:hypothetical protein
MALVVMFLSQAMLLSDSWSQTPAAAFVSQNGVETVWSIA